jgi:hypothetical protein
MMIVCQIEGKSGKNTMTSSMASRQRAMSFIGAKPEPIDMTMDSFDMLKARSQTLPRVDCCPMKRAGTQS